MTTRESSAKRYKSNEECILPVVVVAAAVTAAANSPIEVAMIKHFDTLSCTDIATVDDITMMIVEGNLPRSVLTHIYQMNDIFPDIYFEWPYSFCTTFQYGILYRPSIVDEIYHQVVTNLLPVVVPSSSSSSSSSLTSSGPKGLMIRGPHGIGKSHSLINVIRKLQSTGNYLVTYINCDSWHLIDAIYDSFGISYGSRLGLPFYSDKQRRYDYELELPKFIQTVDAVLKKLNKQWVFVFDQIHRIYAKRGISGGKLPFPYSIVENITSSGRITTIISASDNNEASYEELRTSFREYIHPIHWTHEELRIMYPEEHDFNRLKQLTGNIPFYTDEFIRIHDKDEVRYWWDCVESVAYSIDQFVSNVNHDDKNTLYENMKRIMFQLDFFEHEPTVYDRKYFVQTATGHQRCFQALLPLVEHAWREELGNNLFEFIDDKEVELIRHYMNTETTNERRNRLFQSIVFRRCIKHGVENFPLSLVTTTAASTVVVTVPNKLFYSAYRHSRFPAFFNISLHYGDGVHIPINPLSVIDMMWKTDIYMFGIKIHTSSTQQSDVASQFEDLCDRENWFNEFKENVFLIYLCPNTSCMPRDAFHETAPSGRVKIGYITIKQVECLKDLPF